MSKLPDAERVQAPRLNRSSWIALTVAVVSLVYGIVFQYIYPQMLPGDGWAYDEAAFRAASPRIILQRDLSSSPSPLREQDEVVAIESQSVQEILSNVYAFQPQRPVTWVAGGTVRYSILRDGRELVVDVVLQRPAPLDPMTIGDTLGTLALMLLVVAIGSFVFSRQPRDQAAQVLLVFTYSLAAGIAYLPTGIAQLFYRQTIATTNLAIITPWVLVNGGIVHLLLVFPSPKRVLQRYPGLVLAALYGLIPLVSILLYVWYWRRPLELNTATNQLQVVEFLVMPAIMLASVIHSFLTLRDPVARAQLRWLAFGVGLGFLTGSVSWLVGSLLGTHPLLSLVSVGGFLMIPVTLTIAILRYRLFEIDIIIRRTLIYSVLTAALSLTYIGTVLFLQGVVRAFTGQERSQLVIVVSTLTITALFTPLRRRIQAVIDRRFYRAKYDATRTLQRFSARLRDEVDLGQLTDDLLRVVQDTVQPTQTSLWIRSMPLPRGVDGAAGQPKTADATFADQ